MFFQVEFSPCKATQPLWDKELKEKEAQDY